MSSTVHLLVDDSVDIAERAVISGATFDSAASATPGTCEVTLRDIDRDFTFVTGQRLRLIVDDVPLWAGFGLTLGRTSFFPAGDGKEDTSARKWILKGVDNNILLDKRVLRNEDDYLKEIPRPASGTMDGEVLRGALASYMDSFGPGFDISSAIDDVVSVGSNWTHVQQGLYIRAEMEALAQLSAAVYYIGPDDMVHYHAIQNVESPWGFSDRPNKVPLVGEAEWQGEGLFQGSYWGCREIMADEDGTGFGTDAFVWGGSKFAGPGGTVFYRATDATLEGTHGKWQLSETHFDETNFKTLTTVRQRANLIVFGNPDGEAGGAEPGTVPGEGPRGLRFAQWNYGFVWHGDDVPTQGGVPRHLRVGDLVPIQLWAFSQNGGATPFTKFLPLRSLRISFPSGTESGKAVVRFGGTFDLRNDDSKFLWKYLRKREPKIVEITVQSVTNADDTAPWGAFGQFVPTGAKDGSNLVFTVPFGYVPNTTLLYKNGILLIRGLDYEESDPLTEEGLGEITLTVAPVSADALFLTCRSLGG